MADKPSLRRQLRQSRRSLSPTLQTLAARALLTQLHLQRLLAHARHIAFYCANDGEIDPASLLTQAIRRGKACYLPVLAPGNELVFYRYRPAQRMLRNRYGIAEPARREKYPARALDLVIMPLVGFDRAGNRLGMGAGFYDRTFAFKRKTKNSNKPVLIGLAHSCQEVVQLPKEGWDIPLKGIATDRFWINSRCFNQVD